MNFVPHRRRPGLSLLEVLVAMAIFLFSVIALYHLVSQAADRALDAQQKSQATQLCQAKLAEVIAGAIPLNSQQDVALDEDPDWHWSLDAQPGSAPGLWNVNIKVSRPRPNGFRVESSLSQMVLDPSLRGNNMQPVQTPETAATAGSDNSQSTTGGSSNTPSTTPNTPTNIPSTNPGSGAKSSPSTPAAPSSPSTSKPSTPSPAPAAPSPAPSPAPAAPSAAPAARPGSTGSPPAASPSTPSAPSTPGRGSSGPTRGGS